MNPAAKLREDLGPDFHRLRVLSHEEAGRRMDERDAVALSCLALGAKSYEGNLNKLYTGEMSPGCHCCAEGGWSCLFINNPCNKFCFYCPQDRTHNSARPILEGSFNYIFDKPEEYVGFLKKLKYTGVGFSGGEPFLAMQKLKDYIRCIRGAFGRDFHLWAYTNGTLFTREKGLELAALGLDELRFDISADDYRLESAAAAVQCFKTVTIEIPAIPEDEEMLIGRLNDIKDAGVKFLNLHQLNVTRHNCRAFADRGYTLIREESKTPPILESEMSALRIMQHALNQQIGLSINYCSQMYKMRFQYRGRARSMSALVMSTADEPMRVTVTSTGLLRVFSIKGEGETLDQLGRLMRDQKTPESAYRIDRAAGVLFLHPTLLLLPCLEDAPLEVRYYRYGRRKDMEQETLTEVPVRDGLLPGLERIGPMGQFQLSNEMAKACFYWLFLEAKGVEETLLKLRGTYSMEEAMRRDLYEHLDRMFQQGKNLEYMDTRLPLYR